MKTVYIDGIFDLFHRGHLESLIKAKNVFNDPQNTFLIVGVISDEDATGYKRCPIINEEDRIEIINSVKYVDQVLFPGPLIITNDFIKSNNIDVVVHGFVNEEDKNKQQSFFSEIADHFIEIEYYSKTSTTQIINKIKNID
jgi:cytidyltransferase-like protein